MKRVERGWKGVEDSNAKKGGYNSDIHSDF
jgi:hypothetical protein